MLKTPVSAKSSTADKLTHLESTLADMSDAVIAFSGGVDSTLLAFVANQILGKKALIVFANSPVVPAEELFWARSLAAELKLNYVELHHNQLEIADFVRNDKNRCYHCKLDLHGHLKELASSMHIGWICEGSNFDDLSDYRPGLRAVSEVGMRSPLAESFLTKPEIRMTSKQLGLPNWDKPSAPCLSSRIPYGIPVTKLTIDRIDRGEAYLRSLGFKEVRLRHHNEVARIEIGEADIPLLLSTEVRKGIMSNIKSLGYAYVALDLQGFRSGSLNEVLGKDGKERT